VAQQGKKNAPNAPLCQMSTKEFHPIFAHFAPKKTVLSPKGGEYTYFLREWEKSRNFAAD